MKELLEIVHGCMIDDHKHQKMLYERFYGFALKVVFRYIYRMDRAVDVVNDGFVKVFRSFQKFEEGSGEETEKILMGWIRRIMVNTAIDELRRNLLLPEIGELPEDSWEPADNSQGADQQLLYKELIAQVRKLPPSYRAVFNMHVIDGYSHQEVAHALGISVGTCKSNLSKARDFLKKAINKELPQATVCNL
ncbi:RNA polymerase sigma factor [Paraflavisolibacter sp. H34]|uniref:RNA polymerase sigma factor n=1 Tax=Huijunlia imazamoxiresistens TaxID=3127457 RepID=UPI003016CC63